MFRSLLLLAAVIVVVWYFAGRQKRKRTHAQRRESPRPIEDMVRCAVCGLHLPAGEALGAQGRHFCSEKHRRQWQEQADP